MVADIYLLNLYPGVKMGIVTNHTSAFITRSNFMFCLFICLLDGCYWKCRLFGIQHLPYPRMGSKYGEQCNLLKKKLLYEEVVNIVHHGKI